MLKSIIVAHSKLANGKVILFFLFLIFLANLVIIPAIYPKFQTLDTLFLIGLVGWLVRAIRSRHQVESARNKIR